MFDEIKSRREFLEFFGRSAALVSVTGFLPLLNGCATAATNAKSAKAPVNLPFTPLAPTSEDRLAPREGFKFDVIVRWDDPINAKE